MNTEQEIMNVNVQVEEFAHSKPSNEPADNIASAENAATEESQSEEKKNLFRRILEHRMRRKYYNIIAGALAAVFVIALFFTVLPFINGNYKEADDLWFENYLKYDKYKILEGEYIQEYLRAVGSGDSYRKADIEARYSDAIYYKTYYDSMAGFYWSDIKAIERRSIFLGCLSVIAAFGSVATLIVGKKKGY